MDVQALDVVFSGTEVQEVERAAKVDEERVIARTDEDLAAAGQREHGLRGHRCVAGARERLRADVVRRHLEVVRDDRAGADCSAFAGHLRDRVEVADVEIRVGQRSHRARVVEERVFVEGVRRVQVAAEAELVGDVFNRIAVVVDVDFVEHVIAELVVVRAGAGQLPGDVVGDERHRVWRVRAGERVEVGRVRGRIIGDVRRLAVGRCPTDRGGAECAGYHCKRSQSGESWEFSHFERSSLLWSGQMVHGLAHPQVNAVRLRHQDRAGLTDQLLRRNALL